MMRDQTRDAADFLLRHATAIIFLAVLLWFGIQAPRFLGFDFSGASPHFIGFENVANIIKQASFTGIIAVGMTFVLLTGGIDISVGSNMYVSAMVVGYLLQNPRLDNALGVAAAFTIGLATGAIFGAINAFCVVKLRITPFLVTLATLVAGHGLVTAITESYGIEYPGSFLRFGATAIVGVPIPVVVFALVVAAAHIVLTRTPFGRQIYAIGNDLEAAKKAGIDTGRLVFSVYVICGVCASLAGVMLIALVGRLNQTFGVGREFDVITAAVLGGTSLFGGVGGAFGAIVGSVLVQMVQNGLIFAKVNLYLQPMVLAVIIFVAVFFDSLRQTRMASRRRHIRMDQ
jgi:ribose/xylose/arabinose/galactoside ABC-type transport system permease subunit